jgi:hypothetical protein
VELNFVHTLVSNDEAIRRRELERRSRSGPWIDVSNQRITQKIDRSRERASMMKQRRILPNFVGNE